MPSHSQVVADRRSEWVRLYKDSFEKFAWAAGVHLVALIATLYMAMTNKPSGLFISAWAIMIVSSIITWHMGDKVTEYRGKLKALDDL